MSTSETQDLYIVNPDVVVREEDADGALLFNPDTNDVKVINETGFCIWQACSKACSLQIIVEAVKAEFDEVPEEEVEKDAKEFITIMLQSEFIGRA